MCLFLHISYLNSIVIDIASCKVKLRKSAKAVQVDILRNAFFRTLNVTGGNSNVGSKLTVRRFTCVVRIEGRHVGTPVYL